MQMRSAAASVLGSTVARALKVRSPIRTDRRQNRKGKRCMVMMREGGHCCPLWLYQNARAAMRRSRLRIRCVQMNHWSRLPLAVRVAPRMPWCSISTIRAWMVPLCFAGSNPMARTISEHVCSPPLIRWERMLARTMECRFIGVVWWTERIIQAPWGISLWGIVPLGPLSTLAVLWVRVACRIWGQSDEVRGITVDDNDRHLTCHKIMAQKV